MFEPTDILNYLRGEGHTPDAVRQQLERIIQESLATIQSEKDNMKMINVAEWRKTTIQLFTKSYPAIAATFKEADVEMLMQYLDEVEKEASATGAVPTAKTPAKSYKAMGDVISNWLASQGL